MATERPEVEFLAYIDESGDDGFYFDRGSSRWFVLSAVVTRLQTDHEMGEIVDNTQKTLGRTKPGALHFCKLDHRQRLPFISLIASSSATLMTVAIYKPSLNVTKFCRPHVEKHNFYRYASKILLERVSWYCRDNRRDANECAKVFFSNRAQMSYDDLRSYFDWLRVTKSPQARIDWSVIQTDLISARNHDQLNGLQVADAVASGMYYAVEKKYGLTEPRYAEMLVPRMYRYKTRLLGYGVKIMPQDEISAPTIVAETAALMAAICK